MPRREVSTDGKEPSKTSFDLGGSEIYLQDGVNGRAYAGHGEPNSQCYESSLGTKRTSLHKCVSVIFSAQISRLEQQCVPHHLVEAVDVRDSYLQSINDCQG